jgi:hypothetical protein
MQVFMMIGFAMGNRRHSGNRVILKNSQHREKFRDRLKSTRIHSDPADSGIASAFGSAYRCAQKK